MRAAVKRFISIALISAVIGLAATETSRAQANLPAIGVRVHPQRIARPMTSGIPVMRPLIKGLKSITRPGLNTTPSFVTAAKPNLAVPAAVVPSSNCATASSQPAPLVALVSSLKCDPDLIYEYVYNNIEFEPLYGSNKGPLGTLLDRRGDDADQAILFVTLLNIAGYSQTGYANVFMGLSGDELANWLGVPNDANAIEALLDGGGILWGDATTNPDGSLEFIAVLHFWSALQLGGTWYYFDPSFKQHNISSGISSLASAIGYSRTQFLSDAGGTIGSLSISNINRAGLRSDLASYATNLVNYINQNNRTWSVSNVIGGKSILPLQGSPIRATDSFLTPSSTFPSTCPNQTPAPECRTYLVITMPGASSSQSIKLYSDQVYGHRITVFSTPSGSNFIPTLLIDGAPPACVAAGTCTNVGSPPTAGGGTWSIATQVVEPNQQSSPTCPSGVMATACKTLTVAAGASYLVSVGNGRVGRGMMDYHRQLLAQARAAGNADATELVLGESLAVISYGWLAQVSAAQNILDHVAGVTINYNFAIGITGQAKIQQTGFQGPYVDLPLNFLEIGARSSTGPTTTVGGITYPTAFVAAAMANSQASSAFESAVLEQTQAPVAGMTAASTIKIIDSNMDPNYSGSTRITYFADGTTPSGQSAYTSTILPAITPKYNSSDLSNISSAVSLGNQVLIPGNGKLAVGHWSGAGYTQTLPQTNELTTLQEISGGMSGGFSGTDVDDPPENTEDTFPLTASSDTSNPVINTIPDPSNPFIAEPVDGVTGAYVYKNSDIVTGSGKFPYALSFARTYLSSSGSFLTTTSSDVGMGNGWAHNWVSNIQTQSDPYLGIGVDNSPATSAATSIVALYIMQDLMSVTPTAQTSTVSSMVTRWFTDQLTGNVAIVTRPDTTEEFIALPHADGSTIISFNPPPGSSAQLTQVAAGQFTYQLKNGIVSNFGPNPAGALQSIVYPNGMTINLSYSGSPLALSGIFNNLGRSLTLAYSGTHISSVTDDTGRTVTYGYDGNNNLSNATIPIGTTTTYSYDTSGNFDTFGHLTQVFYPSSPAVPFVTNWYDPLGRVVKQANAFGVASNFYFAGSRTETIDPLLNRHVTYQSDRGRVLSDAYVLSSSFGDVFSDTAQQNGVVNVSTSQYDGLDNLVQTTAPEGGITSYTYDARNNVLTITATPKPGSPLSPRVISSSYDPFFNMPVRIVDPLGLITTMSYDETTGNLLSQTTDFGASPHFNAQTRFTYNGVGQILTASDPLGTVTQYRYDSNGNQISITRDAGTGHLNQVTSLGYSSVGDVVSTTDPKGNVTTQAYDANRRLTTTTLPNATITALTYDPDGHVIQARQSANGTALRTTSATYTLTGKVATTTDANGNITQYAYDADDRLANTTDPLNRQTIYAYDAMGRQISISNPAISNTPLVQQAYTPDGKLASLTDANSNATGFTYDGFDRLATTTFPLGSTKKRTYDADNNVLTRTTRANQTVTFGYDTLNRLITKTPPSPAPVVSYAYDLAGHRTNASDTSAAISAAVPPSGSAVQYGASTTYDALNRPTSVVWNPAPTAAAPTAASVTFSHAYNKANQRIGQTVSDNSWLNYPPATASTVNYTANALNQYTAVGAVTPSYDANGNLTSDGTFTFGYDARNRLTSASGAGNTATYTFDAQGRRKTKTVNGTTTVFVTDADNREVLEYDGSSGAIQRWYAYGIGANAVLNQTNVIAATRTALIPDVQGSIIATLDSAAGALTKTGYLPYGQSASPPSSFGFTSQRIDPETNGLYYYRARHYSPVLGRFLQTDPSGYRGGKNLYAYVNNDPLNNTDRRGLAQDEPDEDDNTGFAASAGGGGAQAPPPPPPPPDGDDPDDEENESLPLFPLGFQSLAQFAQACDALCSILNNAGISDATIGVRGSAVTGYSFQTGAPFGPSSDIDFFIESDQLTAGLATSRNIPGFVYPNNIYSAYPSIAQWASDLSATLGRDVSVGGFRLGSVPSGPIITAP